MAEEVDPVTDLVRCPWCLSDPLLRDYHDAEWGVPVHDDRRHYEFLVLEAAQAGLSWLTVLRKREGYRRRFAGFDPAAVAAFGEAEVQGMLGDPGVVRNRAKIEAAVHNARKVLEVATDKGSFASYLWDFVDGRVIDRRCSGPGDWQARSETSDRLSADLKRRGFKFVGSTTIYAHLQAAGLINDHLVSCYRHAAVGP